MKFYVNFSFIANVLATSLFAGNRFAFTSHSFISYEARISGAKRAKQRHEQCLSLLKKLMRPAFESLTAAHFYDYSVQKSTTELVALAVDDVRAEINENERIPSATRDAITNKLKSVKLSVMFPDDILNLTKITELYNDLRVEGNESLPKLFMKFEFDSLLI